MKPASLLIRGARVITVDAQDRVDRLDVRIDGDCITAIAPKLPARGVDRVIDARGLVAMPGLVQAHVHLCQTLFRSVADDMALLNWLQTRIWPLEGAMTAADMRAAAQLGIAELLLGGTTAILDMGSVQHADELFKAAQAMGLRYTGGKTLMDAGHGHPVGLRETTDDAIAESIRLCDAWHGAAGGRLRYAFSPRFALSCTDTAMRRCVEEAARRGTLLHTHAAENADEVQLVRDRTGMGNVEYLHSLGFSGENVCLAHCVWLSLKERALLRDTRTRVVHCPSANLKLASGIARIAEYLGEGIHVALGADGAACNNRLDGFTELRLAALLHKVRSGPEAIPAHVALRMATRGGALALGLSDVGSIEAGHKADMILLDLGRPHVLPTVGDLVSRVVYAAQATDVHTTIVDGRVVVDAGELVTGNLGRITHAAERAAGELIQRAL